LCCAHYEKKVDWGAPIAHRQMVHMRKELWPIVLCPLCKKKVECGARIARSQMVHMGDPDTLSMMITKFDM
jgi:hypothetical protein